MGDNIGRLLIMEFSDSDNNAFDEIMEVLKKYPDLHGFELHDESA